MYSLKKDKRINPAIVVKMRDSLRHRGPDDCGIYISPDQRFCFGHNRLSIIDLSAAAHQPMSDEDGKIWISYNGEIYNYLQLQNELKEKGYTFRSKSDTEVIIQGYREWGIDGLLEKLRGMFAFAIYDIRDKIPKLILVRDRFGIKPLYYYCDEQLLIFSSEVRAIKSALVGPEKNQEAEVAFLVFGYIPAPLTTVRGVYSLPCGSYMTVEGDNKKCVRYYRLIDCFQRQKIISQPKDIYSTLKNILDEVVSLHLISDAPLGVFLSGGIDSSSLVALASKIRDEPITTLSIIFEEEAYSEIPYQRMITQQYRTDHRQIKVTEKDFYDEIDNIFEAMDQPTVDGINTYFVSRAAKQVGLKSVLSGMGADEIFCGYESFKKIWPLKAIFSLPRFLKSPFVLSDNLNDRWRKLIYFKNDDYLSLYLAIRGLFIPKDAARILDISEKEVEETIRKIPLNPYPLLCNPIDWLSYMEINFYLENQLLKDTDFMSMYHSLETRLPYLDHILVDYIFSIDSTLKINKNTPKPLLVRSLKDMLPDAIVFTKKRGFIFPFDPWIRKRGEELLQETVSEGNINKKYTASLWRKFEIGRLHWSRLWALVVAARS